ncbi:PREDICTED: ATP synthase subunit g, mitochondrial [Polistes canadensis]|uniref:ATP synthase subunit g, mitochondrial n=1 Tax=Polistes canadensis TaxID=91411 RepID=UPI000718F794|nr:PREDICTED: ATP synthase subunit g, mitochondrial [Polistes canadensis]
MAQLPAKLMSLSKNLLKQAKPKLQVFQAYAKVELVPPKLSELPAVRKGITDLITAAKTGRYKELTIREAWLNTLVAIEIYCWFYIGECIGKRHIVGYKV